MIVKDNLIVFPFTTPRRFFLHSEEIDLKVNFTRLSSLVVAMSIRNDVNGKDVFVFVVKGRKYLKLLTFEHLEPLTLTLTGIKAKSVLRIFEDNLT